MMGLSSGLVAPVLASPLAGTEASKAVRLLLLLGIGGLIAFIYWQSSQFEFLEWDDAFYILQNQQVLDGLSLQTFSWALQSFYQANWHPVTWWSYQIDISLFGLNPGAMHLENMLFHAINSLLVYALFIRYKIRPLPALFAAAVFAVHPLHVESVVWISERKDLLSAFFLLALLLVWDRYIRTGRALDYCMVLVLAVLGTMSKPMLVTLPVLLLLLDAWPYARLRSGNGPWFRDRQLLTRCAEKIPFGILAAFCALLTIFAQDAGHAINTLDEVGMGHRLGNAVVSYAVYLVQTIVPPLEQSFMYIDPLPGLIWIAGALTALGLVTWWAVKQGGAALAGWLWFLVTLLPVIGLIKVGVHSRADRYMYLPMIGLLLMLAGTISFNPFFTRLSVKAWRVLWALACGVVLIQAGAAYRYTSYWRDSESLFKHALSINPDNYVAYTLLAVFHEKRGQPEKTILYADRVLELAPQSYAAASAAVSASNAAISLGKQVLARQYLEYGIAIKPKYPIAHYNMGTLELQHGNLEAAMREFKLAIALHPDYSEAYNNLGVALLQKGRKEEAGAAFSAAVRINPDNKGARQNFERTGNGLSQ
jgi:Tfp pilus assembly protein PilF